MIYWTPQMQWSLRDMIHKKYSNYWLLCPDLKKEKWIINHTQNLYTLKNVNRRWYLFNFNVLIKNEILNLG